LDEPTSGLDSSSSNSVVQLVKELANHGRIVVLSIHQPSSKAFHLLDQIMLLAKGQVLYYGAPKGAKDHFEKLGFICPENENTADFILDVATDPENIPLLRAKREETHLSHAFGMSETSLFINPSNADDNSMKDSGLSSVASTLTLLSPNASGSSSADRHESPSRRKSWKKAKSSRSSYVEIQVLFRRTAQNIYRHRSLLMLHVILSITLGLFGGLIFNHVTNDLAGFQNRSGAFYFILTFFGFSSMSSMDLFITERPIFLRETGAMYYGAFSYFLAKATLDAISLRILPATIFACIFYWIMGLQSSIDHFLVFIVTLILFNVAAGSISILIGVISRSAGAANLSGTVVFMIMLLFGGFLLNAQAMPTYVAWLKHFSIFSYAFEILMTNELKGLLINFNAPGYPSIPVYGDVFLKTLGMNYENRFYDMIALSVIAIALQMLSFLFLSLQVPPRSEIFLEDDSSSTENDAEPY
jgi:ATP-binding cassette subfamily G (WHITE) protein 2